MAWLSRGARRSSGPHLPEPTEFADLPEIPPYFRQNGPVTMTRPQRLSVLAGGMTAVLFSVAALLCGVGVWGADPYWYAGDLSMLKVTGEARTNAIFSSTLLDPTISASNLPQWIHSVPYTHIVSRLRPLAGNSYSALLIVNAVSAFATATLVFLIGRKTGLAWPVVPAMAFLTFPATILFTVNTFPEIMLAFAVAMTAYGAQFATGGRSILGLTICGGGVVLLYYNRESFVLAALAFTIFCLWVTKEKDRYCLRKALPFHLAILVAVAVKGRMFPPYPTPGLSTVLMARTSPTLSNMASYDSSAAVPFDLGPFLDKIGVGLRHAVVPTDGFEAVVETPVLFIICWGVWTLRRDAPTWALRFWSVIFLGTYLATAGVFQPGWRYLYSILPIAVVFAGIFWERAIKHATSSRRRQVVRGVSAATLTMTIAVSLSSALAYRSAAVKAEEQLKSMTSAISKTGDASILVVADRTQMMPITYTAVPRPVLTVEDGFNSPEDAARLIERWKPRVFVSGSAADLDLLMTAIARAYGSSARLEHVEVLDTPGGDADMFTLDLSPAP